jgi:hypothetical protein
MLLLISRAGVHLLLIWALTVALGSCTPAPQGPQGRDSLKKFSFDLTSLDAHGLRGEESGLCALSYEFCIPAMPVLAEQVRKIDPTLVIFDHAPGRSQCADDTFLCIGSTHQPGYRNVLLRLSRLSYIERIDEAFFE